jgi:hypothetical protein
MPSLEVALRDFSRVAKRGGEVRCTLPLAGTFQEFMDLYREVLIKHDKYEALDRLERHVARYPTIDHVERCMKSAQLSGEVEVEEYSLLFKSSREFFFAPVIEYGPLAEWKEIAGGGQEMQDVFWYIKEAIDAYFVGRPFEVTVKAGCIIGTKHEPRAPLQLEEQDFDDIDTGMPVPPHDIAVGSVRVSDADTEGVELDDGADFELDVRQVAASEPGLDAFTEGKKRPSYLDLDDAD